jgi:hypothetical protein
MVSPPPIRMGWRERLWIKDPLGVSENYKLKKKKKKGTYF